jgi:NIMA (never in mitosis gene a)-related kinase 2
MEGDQFEKYEFVRDIGKGSFGKVALIKRRSDEKILVWKELNYGRMSEKEKQMLVSEVNILRDLNHTHIVRYFDRVIDRNSTKIFIVMEYCEGGDISALIRSSRKQK